MPFAKLASAACALTGGEPLLRADLLELIARLTRLPLVEDLALTTNATQLARRADSLREAGLRRITVSLDSLQPARFEALTRRAAHTKVLGGDPRRGGDWL